jgi:amylovoran biosynthesis glycosyltransferase AmsE
MNFSVLMSLYDKEKPHNLELCLQSIKNQTLRPSEVVLVIDGPIREELLSIVDNFQIDLNIKKVKLKDNVGLGSALNIGLRKCSNSIIARADTDDICLPNRFALQIPFLIKNNLSLCGGNSIYFFDDGNEKLVKNPTGRDFIKRSSKYKNPFCHPAVAFFKNEIIDLGGYPDLRLGQDYLLWIKVINSNLSYDNMNETLVKVRAGDLFSRRNFKSFTYDIKTLNYQLSNSYINLITYLFIFSLKLIYSILPVVVKKYLYFKT